MTESIERIGNGEGSAGNAAGRHRETLLEPVAHAPGKGYPSAMHSQPRPTGVEPVNELRATSLLPFVPSGADYEAARRLFADLGFIEEWENDGYAGFANGGARFILQRFDDAHFAGNFMVRLNVPDLDAWWLALSARGLEQKYPGLRLKPPTQFPWGREVNFIDLAGVCWHVGQEEG